MGATIGDAAVDGETLPGADHHQVAHAYFGHRDLDLVATAHQARRSRAQRLQRADCVGGPALGPGLQVLAQQDQGDDRGGRLEVQRRLAPARYRPQQVVEAEPVGRRRTQRDQQVHVAGARLQRMPARAVEARAKPELHRGGQRPLHPAGQHPVLPEQHAGHRQHEGQGQQHRDQQVAGLAGGSSRRGRRIARTLAAVDAGLVPGGRDCLQQGHLVGIAGGGNRRTLGGQVHVGSQHTRDAPERALNAPDARGAAHALHGEFQAAGRDPVTRFLDRGDQRGGIQGCACADLGSLTREVDRHLLYAGQSLQGPLDPAHARGAAHSLHGDLHQRLLIASTGGVSSLPSCQGQARGAAAASSSAPSSASSEVA